ncbi:MAG: BatA domain-containing protein [Candidatus Gallimonas sp.]
MSFLYPLGLLGLLAVPVLIVIYIIKNKYTEQIVPATYLWRLSERFLKRRNPVNRITGIISLVLQILAVVFLSFAVAHPVFTLPGAARDYCFILDGSGSMNLQTDGVSRLDAGKAEIRSRIGNAASGSSFTLVYTGSTTSVVYERTTDKEQALKLLDGVSPEYCATGFADALNAAQGYFDENPSVQTVLVTDKAYESGENVEIVNVSKGEINYSVADADYKILGGNLIVTGNAYSYVGNASLELALYLDDASEPVARMTVEATEGVAAPFELSCPYAEFSGLCVKLLDPDALALDNECRLYPLREESSLDTLIVSDTEFFFMQAALASFGNVSVDVVKPSEFRDQSGYGLYIFDSCMPSSLPRDGAVWFFNPDGNVENAGFTVQSDVESSVSLRLEYNQSTATRVVSLQKNLLKEEICVSRYVKCGLYRDFATVLFCENNPAVFAGSNVYGNREVVFAFDVHDSDLALRSDFVVLTRNLLDFTFPALVDASAYYCGDVMTVNVPANCESVRVDSPLGHSVYLETGSAVAEYELTEEGVYTVTVLSGNTERKVNVFSALPLSERIPYVAEQSFVLYGEAENAYRDGRYEDLLILFIVLAVIFIADWMVYCYEQYQLR